MKWKVGKSKIHGNGIFATQDLQPNEDLGAAIPMIKDSSDHRLFQRNTLGLLINDSKDPNVKCSKVGTDWHFITTKSIPKDDEIVIQYQEYMDKLDLESFMSQKRISVV
jgi:hypothetical protein